MVIKRDYWLRKLSLYGYKEKFFDFFDVFVYIIFVILLFVCLLYLRFIFRVKIFNVLN